MLAIPKLSIGQGIKTKISEADFKNLHPNDFEDLYLLHLQGKLNHLSGADKVHLFNAVNLWMRNIVIRQQDYTIVHKPRAVIYRDRNDQKKMMRDSKVHKFSDGTLTRILEKLDFMVKDYELFKFNPGMERRIWTRDDKKRNQEFIKLIEKRLKIRRIFRSLESFVNHNLWDIIVDGDLQEEVAPRGEQSGPPAPKTTKQLTAKRNQERVKSILLLAIPDEYLLKFHNVPDAKSLWAAIKSRFGGNDESKKMQRNVLKHHFENFTNAPNESLDKAYDSQIVLIMRNKPDIDQTDIDDIYNNLRVYEDEIKRSSSSTSNSQNLTFVSSENTRSTNEVSTASGNFGVNTAGGTSSTNQVSSTPGADEVVCSFFAQQTTSPLLDNEDLQQLDQDDLEELDIRWQVAMLTIKISQKLGATTVTGKGTFLRNANQEGTKGKDLMVIMAGGMQQQMNNHHKHWWLKMV
ncbi:hypothetical protein Tco_1308936 [Tanacetum coccineum]